MKRLALLLALSTPLAAADRHPMASAAERTFFDALNASPEKRDAAVRELTTAYAIDATDGRTVLLLGLAHLWTAAEGDSRDPKTIDHLVLAEHHLARAAELNPSDDRIPSWLVPTQASLFSIERRPEMVRASAERLRTAYAKRPAFHSFSVALMSSREKPESERFRAGLEALRQAATRDCADVKDRACLNAPRWPHNVEGFRLFLAEYEARAGNGARATEILTSMKADAAFASWPFQKEHEELTQAVARGSLGDWASPFLGAKRISCQICHQGK